ncbi:hypothetical protein H8958_008126 [Nasalis larvatus]
MLSLIKRVISTTKAPGAIGPYSQAVLVDRTIYISGKIGMDPSSGQLVSGGVAEEAKQALKNMGEILKAAGCDFTNAVKTTVLLADINDFNTVSEIYKRYFKSNFPARAAYQVAALPKDNKREHSGVYQGHALALLKQGANSFTVQTIKNVTGFTSPPRYVLAYDIAFTKP